MPLRTTQARIFTVVPDTNVWAYLVAADAIEELRMTAKRHRVGIVACPAVVYEGLRLSDAREREKRAAAISRGAWRRAMPEAYLESLELRREISRLRPEWLVPHPDPVLVRRYRRNETDWHRDFWIRVRKQPQKMSVWIGGEDRLQTAREDAHRLRREALASQRTPESLDLASRENRFIVPGGLWGSQEIEAWRVRAALSWERDLISSPHETFLDWLLPWVDLQRMWADAQPLVQFWRDGVAVERMPRAWIRWAMSEVQALRKTTAGTPGDNQIATYLPDFDLFATSDKAFAESLQVIRPLAPVPLADAAVLPAGDDAAQALLTLMSELGDRDRCRQQ